MNDYFMHLALEEATKAYQRGSVPVGAVVVNDGVAISSAGNEVRKLIDPTAHAEILAIRRACVALNTLYLNNCDIYVTLEPCCMCAQAISFARIRRVYFGAYDIKGGGIEHGAQVYRHAMHVPEIVGGILESECALILKKFFEMKRI